MECVIRALDARPPRDQPVEVVERKGAGHPDTICDAIAERICVRLSRHYLQRFGVILHHNVDRILLCGGPAHPAFGGGEVQEPLELYLSGRATCQYRGESIPVGDIAVEACRTWLQQHLPELDTERHVKIVPRFRAGSGDLTGLFQRARRLSPPCNDTSCGAGFAPFTPLECAVLAIERTLNSPAAKQRCPAIGQDIKVMGVRRCRKVFRSSG
jgi:S-adenosylmethionine synthetase